MTLLSENPPPQQTESGSVVRMATRLLTLLIFNLYRCVTAQLYEAEKCPSTNSALSPDEVLNPPHRASEHCFLSWTDTLHPASIWARWTHTWLLQQLIHLWKSEQPECKMAELTKDSPYFVKVGALHIN